MGAGVENGDGGSSSGRQGRQTTGRRHRSSPGRRCTQGGAETPTGTGFDRNDTDREVERNGTERNGWQGCKSFKVAYPRYFQPCHPQLDTDRGIVASNFACHLVYFFTGMAMQKLGNGFIWAGAISTTGYGTKRPTSLPKRERKHLSSERLGRKKILGVVLV